MLVVGGLRKSAFNIRPIPHLCRYLIHPSEDAFDKARRYLQQVSRGTPREEGRYPIVLIHYQGNTSAEHKNLSHEVARRLCHAVIDSGYVPVILDWDKRSPLPDGRCIHNPHVDVELWDRTGTGDAAVLAALTELSSLLVGVDSGPLHVAGATTTPTIAVWTRHHPLHYFALADHVTHLVPDKHRELLRGDRDIGEAYFREHYRHSTYAHLAEDLVASVQNALKDLSGALVYTRNFWIRADNAEQDLVVVKDIAEDDSYHVAEFPVEGPVVLDVGAHIGCFCQKVHQRHPGARILAVECCPENIPALRRNVGGFATIIQAAVTYEPDVALLNAVYPNCVTTGGSTVISRAALDRQLRERRVAQDPDHSGGGQYWADFRSMKTLTLEQILSSYGLGRIDILKLDCEGSEFSILENTTSLDRIGLIVGEYHGRERFLKLVADRFPSWDLQTLKGGELGTFWLNGGRRR